PWTTIPVITTAFSSYLPASPCCPKNEPAFSSKPVATINNMPLLFILRKPPLTDVMSPRFLPCVKRQRTATKRHRRQQKDFCVFVLFVAVSPVFCVDRCRIHATQFVRIGTKIPKKMGRSSV